MSTYCDKLPRRYAAAKLNMMLDRWNGPAGDAVRTVGAVLWPGVPLPMLMSMSANSDGPTEAITAAGFWEIGLYNTPAGSPSEAPPVPGSTYARLGSSAELVAALGRGADLGRGRSGAWSRDIPGQVAIGIMDYRDGGRTLAAALPAEIRPQNPSSPWAAALGILAYVEPSSARRVVLSAADVLAGFDETQRFPALCAYVAERFQRTGPVRAEGYPLVRAMQRMFIGEALARQVGESTAWWPSFGAQEEAISHWLTVSRYGAPATSDPCIPSSIVIRPNSVPETRSGLSIGGVVAGTVITLSVVGALAGGWWWYTQRATRNRAR